MMPSCTVEAALEDVLAIRERKAILFVILTPT